MTGFYNIEFFNISLHSAFRALYRVASYLEIYVH